MLRGILRALLAITALAPVLLTWGYVRVKAAHDLRAAILPVAISLACLIVCLGLVAGAKKYLPDMSPFKAESVKASDNDLVTFVLAYLLPLFGASSTALDPVAIGFTLCLLLFIVMSTHAYQTNPLLALVGYHFYEVEGSNGISYSMLSKRRLDSVSDVRRVKQLAPFVILDTTD